MEDMIREAALHHAKGELEKAKVNVQIYLCNPAGIGEHSDVIEAIQVEFDKMATASDRIDMLNKHFPG